MFGNALCFANPAGNARKATIASDIQGRRYSNSYECLPSAMMMAIFAGDVQGRRYSNSYECLPSAMMMAIFPANPVS